MLLTSKFKTISIIFMTGSLILGFQNCAKYSYQDEAKTNTNESLSSEQLPDNTNTPIDQTQPPQAGQQPQAGLPPQAGQPAPPPQEPLGTPQPPVANPPALPPPVAENPIAPIKPPISLPPIAPPEDQECINWALDDHEKKHENKDHGKRGQDHGHNSQDSNKKNETSARHSSLSSDELFAEADCNKKDREELVVKKPRCHVEEEDDNDDEDYQSTCDIRQVNKLKYLNSISSVLNLIGLRGKFVVSPETVGTNSLSKLEDLRGKIVICHMDIDSIKNTRGKIVVYKSNVGLWQDHRGKSVLVDSRVDNCEDHKGKIFIKGSTSVCNSIQNSKGVVYVSRNGL